MNDYFPELDGNQSIDNGKMGRILCKGGGGGSSKTTSEIDPMMKLYMSYGLDEAKSLYEGDGPTYYPDKTYVDPSSATLTGLSRAEDRAMTGSPLIPAAQDELLKTIEGDRLTTRNPFFADMLRASTAPIVDEFNTAIRDIGSRTAQSGRYGSGAMFDMEDDARENLANALTNTGAKLAYTDYGNERALQNQAINNAQNLAGADYADINQLMNVGRTREGYDLNELQSTIARYDFGENEPQRKLGSYLNAVYGAPTPVNSTTTQSGGGK